MTLVAERDVARWVLRLHRALVASEHAYEALRSAVEDARREGVPWTVIAQGLGISRQGAWSTWHDRITEG